jgi:hypothetical protein
VIRGHASRVAKHLFKGHYNHHLTTTHERFIQRARSTSSRQRQYNGADSMPSSHPMASHQQRTANVKSQFASATESVQNVDTIGTHGLCSKIAMLSTSFPINSIADKQRIGSALYSVSSTFHSLRAQPLLTHHQVPQRQHGKPRTERRRTEER